MKHEKIISVDKYIKEYIEKIRKITNKDKFMLKALNCHKYHNEQITHMAIDWDNDLEMNIFTPIGETAYNEIENNNNNDRNNNENEEENQ
jgi:hypothetical protein